MDLISCNVINIKFYNKSCAAFICQMIFRFLSGREPIEYHLAAQGCLRFDVEFNNTYTLQEMGSMTLTPFLQGRSQLSQTLILVEVTILS